ncbi:hypothetical protein MOE47_09640 [Bacillus atrophaeus]|uniref:hypothetical protein n=1 Tax=Bacillus atrophaeus TaxID=1452 RepID=UPI002282DFC1|nr:hypothetical protein [Bacillus atrophaeus]MCY8913183.1 hypothetical protein [Bacillus atrophaeus]MCY9114669.1 hypothetical protein [Bacillus atrophaeus]MEC0924165.1 hypothetical protein [Bacillus atrophaeus]MEC0932776.1 hypothetical protein [Bacillus atrophaeus]
MKIKIIMDSGKEYVTERFDSKEELSKSIMYSPGRINYFSIDEEQKIVLNAEHISSFEILD